MASDDTPQGLGLLLIDIQEVFLRSLPEGNQLQERCCFAAKAASLLKIPVLMTEQMPDKLGSTLAALQAAAPSAKRWPKTAFSALRADGLAQALAEQQVQHLLIAGLETSICIYQTVMDALARSLAVTVLTDCVGGVRSVDSAAVLHFLNAQAKATLLPSETVFYHCLGDAQNPQFRSYHELVKAYRASSPRK